MKDIDIRQALETDLISLLKLEQKLVDAERPYDVFLKDNDVRYYDLDYLISDSNSYLLVVESEQGVVGSGYAQIRPSKQCHVHEEHCYLGFIYLEPEHRGQSIGKLILDSLKSWGIKQGVRHFQLNVYSENTSAIKAYEKAGFNKVSVRMELEV